LYVLRLRDDLGEFVGLGLGLLLLLLLLLVVVLIDFGGCVAPLDGVCQWGCFSIRGDM
jgi:hypothetical protein